MSGPASIPARALATVSPQQAPGCMMKATPAAKSSPYRGDEGRETNIT
ncbi:MAG: hypothetical protein ACLRWL_09330 [Evtepia gabavorous]